MTIHARIKAVRDSITEQGSTANEEIILECAEEIGNNMEGAFLYYISDTPPFDLETIENDNPTDPNRRNLDWFISLNNEATELEFWKKTNSTPERITAVNRFWDDKIPSIIKLRFQLSLKQI